MKELMIKLTSFSEIERFVNIANEYSFDIDISSGYYTVNAKSMMAVFSLEFSELLHVKAKGKDKDCMEFCRAVAEFTYAGRNKQKHMDANRNEQHLTG